MSASFHAPSSPLLAALFLSAALPACGSGPAGPGGAEETLDCAQATGTPWSSMAEADRPPELSERIAAVEAYAGSERRYRLACDNGTRSAVGLEFRDLELRVVDRERSACDAVATGTVQVALTGLCFGDGTTLRGRSVSLDLAVYPRGDTRIAELSAALETAGSFEAATLTGALLATGEEAVSVFFTHPGGEIGMECSGGAHAE